MFLRVCVSKKKMTKLTGLSAAAALPGKVDLRNWISLLGVISL